jgi:acyl carrier protein
VLLQVLPNQLQHLFADIFEIPPETVTPLSSPDTVGTWDSIRHLNLVVALEQEFGIQFEPDEIEQMLSVELIVDLLNEKRGKNGAF